MPALRAIAWRSKKDWPKRVRDVLVLCYHGVSERWTSPMSVTPRALEEQLSLLIRRGYQGATFTEAVTSPPAPKTVAVTFDDAYRSVFELGLPILSKLGFPGTVFVPTAKIGGDGAMAWPGIDHWIGGAHEQELVGMSWEELRALAERGWEIGSHTRSHPHLTTLRPDLLSAELTGSRQDLQERLGNHCSSLAYPFGDFDDRVVEAAAKAGYIAAGSLDRFVTPRALEWPRIGIYLKDDLRRFEMKVSPALRWLRASRMGPLMMRVRRATLRRG
jgi:peptidoglycan/xylan/chitin deacetylase (PgdA/CDA1 family)